MNGLSSGGIFIGHWFGITVRIHWSLLLYGYYLITRLNIGFGLGLAMVAAFYLCILLHEFGHSLAAKWCDGHSDEILLWPLGGLAFCRVPFSATANLITAAAGPFVTLVIWGTLALITPHLPQSPLWLFLVFLQAWNGWLLIFNLLPAYPMDGGRILRDILWYFVGVRRASEVAFWLGRLLGTALIVYGLYRVFQGNTGSLMLAVLGFFQISSIPSVDAIVAEAAGSGHKFSIKDRLKRGSRVKRFQEALKNSDDAVHECAVCGRTELSDPNLDFVFRGSADGSDGVEYCVEHLPAKE